MYDDDSLNHALTAELHRLVESTSIFMIIEFTMTHVAVWAIRRDVNDTPQARRYGPFSLPPSSDPAPFYEQKLSPLIDPYTPLLVVRSGSATEPQGILDAIRAARDVCPPVYDSALPVEPQLREAITATPLTRWYELVVLRQTRSGWLGLDARPLFPPGAEHGYTEQVRIRCEPGDGNGTVFAVVTRDGDQLRPVSVESAVLPADEYQVRAVLTRPGRVRFEGLPVTLKPEPRAWREIVATLPARLVPQAPAHLVCLLEVAGGDDRLRRRIDRLDQLIKSAGSGHQRLAVSLVTYGPHAFDKRGHEEPATVAVWAGSDAAATAVLSGLALRKQPANEYPRAAQLECALAAVTARLVPGDGRPVVLTVGALPPFPPRSDVVTEILPCPRRQDWRSLLRQLGGIPGISFGALFDGESAAGEPWSMLGRQIIGSPAVADMGGFATALGLRDRQRSVPFPLLD